MRDRQRGFTLVELVIAVAITAVLLAAGGVWLGSMHPGALRGAVDDFDANLAAARAVAAASGNGATIAVLARVDRQGTHTGFELRVYSGRPNAANAVQPTNVMLVQSNATISEKTFGKPPFSIFLSSAGHPTGMASYPALDARGNVTFSVVSAQPPCPAGGILLTFTSPQGATDTRSLQCSSSVAGASAANPSPTPNVPIVIPKQLVAHWTSDNAALHFVAAEFGYTHWFASASGTSCGAAATYNAGWPYSTPPDPNEAALGPAPPSAPYSWPSGASMNDAPASFAMSPVKGSPGICAVDIVDDYGQHAGAAVQVMGDLTPAPAALTFSSPAAAAQNVTFAKTYDSETITLKTTDNCAGIATYAAISSSAPPSPSSKPAQSVLKITPRGAGQCDVRVGDQYGEPPVDVHITVNNAVLSVWPPAIQFPVNGSQLASIKTRDLNIASTLNWLLGGATADASLTPCAINQPRAFASAAAMTTGSTPLTNASDPWGFGIRTDANGCLSGPNNTLAVVHEGGYAKAFISVTTCGNSLQIGGWFPSQYGPTAGQVASAGTSPSTSCSVEISDQSSTAQTGTVAVSVIATACDPTKGDTCATATRLFFQCYSWAGAYQDKTCINYKHWTATIYFQSMDSGNSWVQTGATYKADWVGNASEVSCPASWGQQTMNSTPAYSWLGGSTESGVLVPSWYPSDPPSWPTSPGLASASCS